MAVTISLDRKDKKNLSCIMAKGTPSLNLIRVFDAAARTGSFARAAQRLAMSAPAVSQQIRALEQHLGRQLFHRDAAGVRLTDEGRALLSICTAPLAQIESATAEFARPRQKTLVVGASLMFSVAWLAPRLPQFLSAHPSLRLDLRTLYGRPEQGGHDMDIWVAFGPFGPGLVAQRLFGERLTPVATPELAQTIRTQAELLAQNLIEPSAHETTWAHVLGLQLLPAGVRLTKVDNSLAALNLAAAGGGVALARAPATDSLVVQLGLQPCALPECNIIGAEAYHVLHPESPTPRPETRRFRDWMLAQAASAALPD